MPPLPLLVFVVGTGSLGAEVAAVRLLAPYFGASTVVWANTIGVVLVALSIGYWLGGRWADRNPSYHRLCLLTLAAVLLLGAVSPWALRLAMDRVEDAGKVAGRLYALSTAGSLAGTLLSALLLIPLVGTRRTFLIFALAIAVIAVWGLRPVRRYALAPAAIAALIAMPVGTLKASDTDGGRVIHEAETEYQYARVVEYPDGH